MKDRNEVAFIFLLLLSVAMKEDWGGVEFSARQQCSWVHILVSHKLRSSCSGSRNQIQCSGLQSVAVRPVCRGRSSNGGSGLLDCSCSCISLNLTNPEGASWFSCHVDYYWGSGSPGPFGSHVLGGISRGQPGAGPSSPPNNSVYIIHQLHLFLINIARRVLVFCNWHWYRKHSSHHFFLSNSSHPQSWEESLLTESFLFLNSFCCFSVVHDTLFVQFSFLDFSNFQF